MLKVGATAAGATAAAAHTGALAGDQRVFRALVEEAGAAWADDVHDLLELAKALAVPARAALAAGAGGLAILTCSGGDSGSPPTRPGGSALPLADAGRARRPSGLAPLLPAAATVGNPLDYTAMIWGERERLAEIVRAVADDAAVGQLLLFFDEPEGMDAGLRASWDAVREGLADGGGGAAVPALVASTLPELLRDDSAAAFLDRGIAAVAGLRTALACAAALARPAGDAARLRAIAAAAAATARGRGEWLSEAGAKALLRGAGVAVPRGRLVAGEDDAGAAAASWAGRWRSRPPAPTCGTRARRARSRSGSRDRTRCARRTGAWRPRPRRERRARGAHGDPGVELIVAARRDAVVPALVVGLGGVWTELLGDVAIVPLPASAARVEAALRGLRGAGLLAGARGRTAVDLPALAALAAAAGELRSPRARRCSSSTR